MISVDESECAALADEIVAQEVAPAGAGRTSVTRVRQKRAFDAARAELGRIEGAFLVAGGSGRRFGDGPIDQVDADAWRETIELNLTTTALSVAETVRIVLDQEPAGGSVVLVSSAIARHPPLLGTSAPMPTPQPKGRS